MPGGFGRSGGGAGGGGAGEGVVFTVGVVRGLPGVTLRV